MEYSALEIAIGVITTLVGISFGLSLLLAQKIHRLNLADKVLDALIDKLELPEDLLLLIRKTKKSAARYEKTLKILNSHINDLTKRVAELENPNPEKRLEQFADAIENFKNQ